MTIQDSSDDNLGVRLFFPLALSQTIVWASTFYLFPALLAVWESRTDWTKSELTGAFALSLLFIAITSPLIGKLIDRGYGVHAIIFCTAGVVPGLLVLGFATSLWQFYLGWIWIGCCMGGALYEACFGLITRHYGLSARPVITRITLIAGLAGTVSFPAANFLAENYDWRVAVFTAAASVLLLALPLVVYGLNTLTKNVPVPPTPTSPTPPASESESSGATNTTIRHALILIALGYTMVTISHTMILTHLVALLAERGIMAFAIFVAATIGPMQIVGRLIMVVGERHITTPFATLVCYSGMSVAALCLLFGAASRELIFGFAILHGASWGTLSILRPILTRQKLGALGYGHNSGRIAALGWLGSAFAPFGGALLWQLGGYNFLLATSAILSIGGVLTLLLLARVAPETRD